MAELLQHTGRRAPSSRSSVGIASKMPGSQANVKMGGEVLSYQSWSREVMGPLLQWSEGWAGFQPWTLM